MIPHRVCFCNHLHQLVQPVLLPSLRKKHSRFTSPSHFPDTCLTIRSLSGCRLGHQGQQLSVERMPNRRVIGSDPSPDQLVWTSWDMRKEGDYRKFSQFLAGLLLER